MKKSTFLAVAGVILAFFIVSAFGKIERAYEKKENFKNPEDAIVNFIGYVNSFELVKADNGSYRVPSREFLESISKRYRLDINKIVLSEIDEEVVSALTIEDEAKYYGEYLDQKKKQIIDGVISKMGIV